MSSKLEHGPHPGIADHRIPNSFTNKCFHLVQCVESSDSWLQLSEGSDRFPPSVRGSCKQHGLLSLTHQPSRKCPGILVVVLTNTRWMGALLCLAADDQKIAR